MLNTALTDAITLALAWCDKMLFCIRYFWQRNVMMHSSILLNTTTRGSILMGFRSCEHQCHLLGGQLGAGWGLCLLHLQAHLSGNRHWCNLRALVKQKNRLAHCTPAGHECRRDGFTRCYVCSISICWVGRCTTVWFCRVHEIELWVRPCDNIVKVTQREHLLPNTNAWIIIAF